MTAYKTTPLFGGALHCDLPEQFADVRYRRNSNLPSLALHELTPRSPSSKIRQVPNNQEVYIDKDGFTSIIFDITERVGPRSSSSTTTSNLETDGRALTTHLEELVGDDADTVKVWNTTETSFSHLECVPLPHPPPSPSPPKIHQLTPPPPAQPLYPRLHPHRDADTQ